MGLDEIQKYFPKKETKCLTHNFHKYPHRLIPQIVRILLKEYTKEGSLVLDPFCGSGTVLVESSLLNRKAVGYDLNPLACLISRVKTTPLRHDKLNDAVKKLLTDFWANLGITGTLKDFIKKVEPIIPDLPEMRPWFQEEALFSLGILKALINDIEDVKVKDFCLVAFSSTVKDVSDASPLYKLTRKRNPKKITKTMVFQSFKKKIEEMCESISLYNPVSSAEVFEKDARSISLSADFVITNPPRFYSDFASYFKIYFWWLELGSMEELENALIGAKKGKRDIKPLGISLADETVSKIKRRHVAAALSKYYYDMKDVFGKLHSALDNNGICCVYTSDSVLFGNNLRIPETFVKLAEESGFKLEKKVIRKVPKKAFIYASADKTEEFLIFKKS